jgi:hypothetical protein
MNSKARTSLNLRAIRIKNAQRTYFDTRTSPFTKGVPRSAGSSCRVKDLDGTISSDEPSEYPLMQQPLFSAPSTPSLSLKGWPIRLLKFS